MSRTACTENVVKFGLKYASGHTNKRTNKQTSKQTNRQTCRHGDYNPSHPYLDLDWISK